MKLKVIITKDGVRGNPQDIDLSGKKVHVLDFASSTYTKSVSITLYDSASYPEHYS